MSSDRKEKFWDRKDGDVHDPSEQEIKEILAEWPSSPYMMLGFVKQIFPGWIQHTAKQFAIDLGKFNLQWANACVQLGCRPGKVLLVSNTFLEERKINGHNHRLLDEAIKRLTEVGHVIMGTNCFSSCSSCGEVIVSEERLKSNGFYFSGQCQGCFPYDPKKPLQA